MNKAIIFDYGKVIGNDPSNYIYKSVSKEFGISITKIKNEFLKFIFPLERGEILEKNFWKKLAKDLNITNCKKLKRVWIGEFRKYAKIDKKILSLANALKNHYKLCLLSNNAIFYQNYSITKSLKKVFPTIIYSFNVKMRKPEKRIYHYTLRKLRVKPNESLIIDDDETKLFLPKKLGMETLLFKSFSQFKRELIKKLDGK